LALSSSLVQFRDLQFQLASGSLSVRRRLNLIAKFNSVSSIEFVQSELGDQEILLVRLISNGLAWLLFADYDGVQTNLREVDSSLSSAEEVIKWLLPPDFFARQGDVGIYRGSVAEKLDPCIKSQRPDLGRHTFESRENCILFCLEHRMFARVLRETRMMHPEHAAVVLPPGEYEFRYARGTSYPILQRERPVLGSPLF
jgi:hypothetical protein